MTDLAQSSQQVVLSPLVSLVALSAPSPLDFLPYGSPRAMMMMTPPLVAA